MWFDKGQAVVAAGDFLHSYISTGEEGTCRCLAVSPIKISSIDAGLQGACDRIGSSLDVGFKEFSVQPSYGIHAYLTGQEHTVQSIMKSCTLNKLCIYCVVGLHCFVKHLFSAVCILLNCSASVEMSYRPQRLFKFKWIQWEVIVCLSLCSANAAVQYVSGVGILILYTQLF